MAQKNNKPKSNTSIAENQNKTKTWIKQAAGFRSMLVLFAGFIILIASIKNNAGYNWAWESLLKGNWKTVKTYPSANIADRYAMKMGFTAQLLEYIKTNSPEDAVLLLPTKEQLREKSQYNIDANISNRNWVLHYLYPRRVMYADEDYPPLRQLVNYVVIVNGHGYESLNVELPPEQRPPFTVIPTNNN